MSNIDLQNLVSVIRPHWAPKPEPSLPPLTAAEREADHDKRVAAVLDHVNLVFMNRGLPVHPEARRSFYPMGYGPGQMIPAGPDRAKVAAYVDSFIGPTFPISYDDDAA